MSHYLSQIPSQQMRQEQRLTPQLIQCMNILQLNVTALENRIQEELEKNPILEYEPDRDTEQAASEQEERLDPPDRDGTDVLVWLSEQYDFDSYGRRGSGGGDAQERDGKMDAMANTASRPINLYEYLNEQWSLLGLDPDARRAGEAVISFLDEDGLLRTSTETIADSARPKLEPHAVRQALVRVQQLDPPGIGARDLKECLLLQLRAMPGDNSLEERIIKNHFEDVVKNRLPQVAKSLGCNIEEINEAIGVLTWLTPSPGLSVVDRQAPHIKADVLVDYAEDGQGYTVKLARGNDPRIRISNRYLKMLKDRNQDKTARDYLKKHYESASAIIDAITFRKNRLLEVAEAVVERQQEFFDQGPQAKKVLRMSELAEQFDCDPSTISRTVADKYMQSPRGIIALRDFFVGGTETHDGQVTSWDSVKARVQELIDHEDKANPLSDDQVAAQLGSEGIELSRRTVAKYRQQLEIPTARQRKVY